MFARVDVQQRAGDVILLTEINDRPRHIFGLAGFCSTLRWPIFAHSSSVVPRPADFMTGPGAIAFTRISGPSDSALTCVSIQRADLLMP